MVNKGAIKHLVGIERQAEELIAAARREADRRIGEVKKEEAEKHKAAYDATVKLLEDGFSAAKEKAIASRARAMAEYDESLERMAVSDAGFRVLVASLLENGA
jgi:vacuolar-type H+-ATPase subunit H